MEQITQIMSIVGSVVASVLLPLIGIFIFYDSKKRKEKAEADKAETDNINSYAEEWKNLYEKKEHKVTELEAKIDILHDKAEQDRTVIRDLREENFNLKLDRIEFYCNSDCRDRKPPYSSRKNSSFFVPAKNINSL